MKVQKFRRMEEMVGNVLFLIDVELAVRSTISLFKDLIDNTVIVQ